MSKDLLIQQLKTFTCIIVSKKLKDENTKQPEYSSQHALFINSWNIFVVSSLTQLFNDMSFSKPSSTVSCFYSIITCKSCNISNISMSSRNRLLIFYSWNWSLLVPSWKGSLLVLSSNFSIPSLAFHDTPNLCRMEHISFVNKCLFTPCNESQLEFIHLLHGHLIRL